MPRFDKGKDFLVFTDKCVGCGLCVLACSAVKFQAMDTGSSYISVERDHSQWPKQRFQVRFLDDCDSCGYCLEFCYFDAIRNVRRPHPERVTLPEPKLSRTYAQEQKS